jgi:hypothetical protein
MHWNAEMDYAPGAGCRALRSNVGRLWVARVANNSSAFSTPTAGTRGGGLPHDTGSSMVNFPGRDRRRRVLKDEVLAASNNHSAMRAAADASADDAPRYSDAAGVENHPQVTDFIPRRYRTIAILVMIGVGTTTVLAALDYFAGAIAQASGARAVNAIVMTAPGSLASWLSAVLLLIASGTCLLTYSIRRHRIDDFRGRYRVWLGASIVCLTMSANSVTGLHQTLADILSHATGWAALRDGAAWWLMVPGLPVAWVLFRALFDVRECRFAAALALVAVTSYAISAASFLGLSPTADPQARALAVGTTLLAGHWFVLAAAVSYARFVVLDAQGLITARRPQPAKKVQKAHKSVAKTDLPTVTTTAK